MNPVLETNQRHSRMLFLASFVISLLLCPGVLRFVERSMDSLNPSSEHTTTQANRNSSAWNPRAMREVPRALRLDLDNRFKRRSAP